MDVARYADARQRIADVNRVHTGRPFPVFAHSRMLGDHRRLSAFRRAIAATVRDPMEVVDIGAGTGILASYAAEQTTGRVVAIEVDESAVMAARILLDGTPWRHVELYQGLSLGRPVEAVPDVLVAELLGPLGLEENIVEIAAEFVRSYPTIRHVIPTTVSVLAVAGRSRQLGEHCAEVLQSFRGASHGAFEYGRLERFLDGELCRAPVTAEADDWTAVAPPLVLARFTLGHDRRSAFSAVVTLDRSVDWEFINLYFEAELSAGVWLSTAADAHLTHWPRQFVKRPTSAHTARVSYVPGRQFAIEWS